MKYLRSFKLLWIILATLAAIGITGTSSYAADTWEDMGVLKQVDSPLNAQYERVVWDSTKEAFDLYFSPPTSSYCFLKYLSFGVITQTGYDYKLVWSAKCVNGTSYIDGRSLPADGSYSQSYETYGTTLSWNGMSGTSVELKNVKLMRKKVHGDWEYQGEIKYNTNPVDTGYEKRSGMM